MSPLLALALSFCLGVFLAITFCLPVAVLFPGAAAVVALCAMFNRSIKAIAPLLCGLMLLDGAVIAAVRTRPAPSEVGLVEPGMASVRGMIVNEPDCAAGKTRAIVATSEAITGARCRLVQGKILVLIKGKNNYCYGDQLLATGELLPPEWVFPAWRGNYAAYLKNHGITKVLTAENWQVVVTGNKGSRLQRVMVSIRRRVAEVLRKRLSPQSAAVMQAMVLGNRKAVSPLIYQAMVNSGTVHILVVSGFNVGIVALMLAMLLKVFRIPRRPRFFLLLPGVIFYCLLTGASEPVTRAGIMAIVMAAAFLNRRDGDIQNAFALAVCGTLAINPRLLFDASFQLSYVSVFSLIVLYPLLRSWLHIKDLRQKFLSRIVDGLLVSFSAWLGTVGFIAWYFRIIAPGAVLINLFAAPLAGFITLCGFSLVMMDRLCPFLAGFIAVTADYAIGVLVSIVSLPFPVVSLGTRR